VGLIVVLIALVLFASLIPGGFAQEKAKKDKALIFSQAALAAATAGDYLSSIRLREANPILGQNAIRRSLVMSESSAAVGLCSWLLNRRGKHRTIAIALNAAVTGLHAWAVIHNARQR
jgi:hypothetical protein